MARAKDARTVALDMTVIRHFHDAGFLVQLMTYLPTAFVVDDVHRELTLQARSRPQLQGLDRARWPKRLGQLPKALIDRGIEIQNEWLEEGDPADAHLGEIYTILAASHFDLDLIITDDGAGLRLASAERVRAIKGGELAAEMVVEGDLDLEDGWAIYQLTRRRPKRENYDRLVQAARAEAQGAARREESKS
jgi:hypothetical protein